MAKALYSGCMTPAAPSSAPFPGASPKGPHKPTGARSSGPGSIVGAVFVALALAIVLNMGTSWVRDRLFPQIGTLEGLIASDYKTLAQQVPQLGQISKYTVTPGNEDPVAQTWAQNLRWPDVKPDGPYIADVLIVSQDNEGHAQALVQIAILDKKTKDLVREVARTYTLN